MFYRKSIIGFLITVACLFFLSSGCLASDETVKPRSVKRGVDTSPRTPSRQKETKHQYAPASGDVKSLCCGSVNAQTMTGENCAFLAVAANCAGQILSCAPGKTEWIDPNNGGGGCD